MEGNLEEAQTGIVVQRHHTVSDTLQVQPAAVVTATTQRLERQIQELESSFQSLRQGDETAFSDQRSRFEQHAVRYEAEARDLARAEMAQSKAR